MVDDSKNVTLICCWYNPTLIGWTCSHSVFSKLMSAKRRCSRVVKAALLNCRKLPEGHEFKAGLCHPTAGKLSLSTQQ